MSEHDPSACVRACVRAARGARDEIVADPELLRRLVESTGLSAAGVELALNEHLETYVTEERLRRLLSSVTVARRVHVVLSANVFVASMRAIALALASAPEVIVKASRREHEFVDILLRHVRVTSCGASIERSSHLATKAGDIVHVYGRDETVEAIAANVGEGVRIWPHAAGMGVAVVDASTSQLDWADVAARLVRDVVVFDQNGCLSLRMIGVLGEERDAVSLAVQLARALESSAERIPIGRRAREAKVSAEATRYRTTVAVAGRLMEMHDASGEVGCSETFILPPAARMVHVTWARDGARLASMLSPWAQWVAAVGVWGDDDERLSRVLSVVPAARRSELGYMQRPDLDGPVDRRVPAPLTVNEVLERYGR